MARYIRDLPTGMSPEQAGGIITGYMQSEGFSWVSERGENLWKKGGIAAIPQFVRAEPAVGYVHIEAWVAGVSVVPGVYGGEQDLDGAWGFAIKAKLKGRIAELERRLGGGVAQGYPMPAQTAVPQTPPGWYPDPHGRHQSRYWDGAMWTTNVADNGVQSTDLV